jgi:WD40 repeat protein
MLKLATSIGKHSVRLWEVDTNRPSRKLAETYSYAPFAVASAPKSSIIASANEDGTLCLWDAKTAKLQRTLKHELSPKAVVLSMCLSPNEKHMVSADTNGALMLWNTLTGERLWHWNNDEHISASIQSVEFSADGKRIISGNEDGRIRLWELEKKEPVWISPKQEEGDDI